MYMAAATTHSLTITPQLTAPNTNMEHKLVNSMTHPLTRAVRVEIERTLYSGNNAKTQMAGKDSV